MLIWDTLTRNNSPGYLSCNIASYFYKLLHVVAIHNSILILFFGFELATQSMLNYRCKGCKYGAYCAPTDHIIDLMQIWWLLISINWMPAIHLSLIFKFFNCLPVFDLQLWNLAVLLILTCFFSWWGSFLWFMLISSRHIWIMSVYYLKMI